MTVRQQLMNRIGFLKWVELSQKAIAELELYDNPDRVFLSPDVHSLHLVWTIKSDAAIQHEIADYPDLNVTLTEFLEDEIMDDAWDTYVSVDVDDIDNIYTEFLSTHSDETAETVRVVSLADLS